jgi:carbamoyl-phosphate synthase large subunit
MKRDIRVLVTSISKKVPLIMAVKDALNSFGLNSRLFGADIDNSCIAKYFVDEFWHMPKQDNLTSKEIIDYCKQHEINTIIPTRDGELIFWSKIKDLLLENNIHIMTSNEQSLNLCLDKLQFFQFFEANNLKTPKTSEKITDIECMKYVVKEKTGSGSRGIGLNLGRDEAIIHSKTLHNPVFQPYITGSEYTVDLYINKDNNIQGIIARKRILVIDGESQISETESSPAIENICKKAALKLNLKGHVLFQVIHETNNENYYIIECNPRFGGASTLSVKAGLDSFYWFFQETLNEPLPKFKRSLNEIKLIRHAADTYINL